ncbi:hypothetical protein [Niabella hibiscisoli]|uniref:hypothetical protein n=1 Tax=Niabella hibiscisoli TaxID=1825928 RepID=UPI001F0E2F91|nr:hypothetical protein [Niabella hibiscisoli]MCH5718182.1 hypothetical protein [Niabella hibiscisoli]
MSGKIIVVSDSVIEVDKSSRLKNILLIAPLSILKRALKAASRRWPWIALR